jgi:predicted RNA-binding Zn ribbon-like protein
VVSKFATLLRMLPDPGDREPAPEPLRMVQAFVNTVDVENDIEELTDPGSLHEVLTRIGALDAGAPELTQADLRRAVAVREALRSLLHVNVGLGTDPAALELLDRTGATGSLSIRFARDGSSRLHADGSTLDAALGRILAVVYSAMVADNWSRLKACPRDVCGWIFYDRSRNSSSRWCAMSVCGNRTKTKRFRAQAVAR